jgi:glycosyltransferase involved in cell wall biosynthesis
VATDSFPPNCGGSGWSTWELCRGLRARGHVVEIVQPRPATPSTVRAREFDGFAVAEWGAPAPAVPYVRNWFKNERLHPRLARFLAEIGRERSVEIVHGQHVLTGLPSVAAARALGVPSVCTVRDYWPVCYWSDLIHDPRATSLCPACGAAAMTRCLRPRAGGAWPLALPAIPYMLASLARKREGLADAGAVVAVSTAIAADLRERAPEMAQTRIETIPNPVDVEAVRGAVSARPRPLDGPYVVYVGKLAPNKGVAHLVAAARAARLAWPLVVVGDGPSRPAVESEARASGLDVRFTGWLPRDESLAWLANATLLMFPSHGPESLSRVLLEAGALGVPVAAMDTGGTRDIVTHEVTGLLSTSREGLARDVARLAADETLRSRLAGAAQMHVERTFASSEVAKRVEALYEDLTRRGARPKGEHDDVSGGPPGGGHDDGAGPGRAGGGRRG